MYEFHQKYITRKFSANLLFTETDSLIYEIKTEVYEGFYVDENLFDFSNYLRSLRDLKKLIKKLLVK